jgi:hypothetical protein
MRAFITVCLLAVLACGEQMDAESYDMGGLDIDQTTASDAIPSSPDSTTSQTDATTASDVGLVDMSIQPPIDCESETACGTACVDTQTDPRHCGGCGRTCVFFEATAQCVDGVCALGTCSPGFFDTDDNPETGCEQADGCVPEQGCVSECNTPGITQCIDGVESCTPPQESCNAEDDNCDGQCDEGGIAGCRVGIFRAYGGSHAYHKDDAPLIENGFTIERANYFYVYQAPVQGMRPMFFCRKASGHYFLASGTACEPEMRAPIAELGFWSPTPLCGSIPLYGLYKAEVDNHFYTTSSAEADAAATNLGYEARGIAGYVWPSP